MPLHHVVAKLCFVLTIGLLTTVIIAPAWATVPMNSVTLDKAAYFLGPDGETILLQAGDYSLEPLADGLMVHPAGDQQTIAVQGSLKLHNLDLQEPVATSIPGQPESETADRHILALLLPGGMTVEADGTYSGIRSRAVSPQELITDPMTVYLDKPIHFQSAEDQDVVPPVGTYNVELADQKIRLIAMDGNGDFLLETQKSSHEGGLQVPVALSLPGAAGEEADLHYVVLLLPDGANFQALGTYSGVRPRGLFDFVGKAVQSAGREVNKFGKNAGRTIQQAKKTVDNATRPIGQTINKSVQDVGKGLGQAKQNLDKATRPIGQGINKAAQDVGKGLNQAGKDVGRFAQQAALEAKKQAEWLAKQAAMGALEVAKAACKAGLTASRIAADIQGRILGPIMGALAKAFQLDKTQTALRQALQVIKQKQGPAIQEAINAGLTITEPKNLKTVKQLMDPNQMCESPGATVQHTFKTMIGAPLRAALTKSQNANPSPIRSRGTFASANIGIGGNLAKVGGGELGVSYAFDFVHTPHWYLDLAAMLKTNVGGGGGVSIGIFPKVNPDAVGGWFLGVGVGFPFPHPKLAKAMDAGLDVFFEFPLQITPPFNFKWNLTSPQFFLDHFQGFSVSVGAGKSVSPVDIALKAGVGIKLTK